MKSFRVYWEIDLEANSPRQAAKKALEIHRDPASIATVFIVRKLRRAKTIDSAYLPIFPDDVVIDLSKSRKRRKRSSGPQRTRAAAEPKITEPLASIDRPGSRKEAIKLLAKFGA